MTSPQQMCHCRPSICPCSTSSPLTMTSSSSRPKTCLLPPSRKHWAPSPLPLHRRQKQQQQQQQLNVSSQGPPFCNCEKKSNVCHLATNGDDLEDAGSDVEDPEGEGDPPPSLEPPQPPHASRRSRRSRRSRSPPRRNPPAGPLRVRVPGPASRRTAGPRSGPAAAAPPPPRTADTALLADSAVQLPAIPFVKPTLLDLNQDTSRPFYSQNQRAALAATARTATNLAAPSLAISLGGSADSTRDPRLSSFNTKNYNNNTPAERFGYKYDRGWRKEETPKEVSKDRQREREKSALHSCFVCFLASPAPAISLRSRPRGRQEKDGEAQCHQRGHNSHSLGGRSV